jgi:conjugative transfer region protein TrbK
MDGRCSPIGAAVFVAVAITATAIEMTRKEEAPASWSSGRAVQARVDPLRDALIRCQALGEDGPRDPACRRAWAENRNRFLAPCPPGRAFAGHAVRAARASPSA